MISTLYIERDIANHPRVAQIRRRFAGARVITCEQYGEVFNRKAQNFRLQKSKPALILARKFRNFVLPAPADFAIGGRHNYYFSHMLNCLYDCRYCFLQGMYRSAHYVLFVNYESFAESIAEVTARHRGESVHFFSGYDCDSLALEPVSGFVDFILPVFAAHPHILLELRTKSTRIRSLLQRPPVQNCVVAFSLTPERIARALEHNAPGLSGRLQAMKKLQESGWQIGLRFDPVLYQSGFATDYAGLFTRVFTELDAQRIHSVSLGSFRLPKAFYRGISRLYPQEPLFASPLQESDGLVSYRADLKANLLGFCRDRILSHIPAEKFFPCENW